MLSVEIYAFEKADGNPETDWTTQNFQEAENYARDNQCRLVARTYEYIDTDVIADYTVEEDEDEGEDEEEGGGEHGHGDPDAE